MDTPVTNHDRYEVSAAEVRDFTEQGFLVVPQLVAPDEVRELRDHTEEVISGDLVIPGRIEPPAPDATPEQVDEAVAAFIQVGREKGVIN